MLTTAQKLALLSLLSFVTTLLLWLLRGLVNLGASWPGIIILVLAALTIGSFLGYWIFHTRH